MVWNRVWGENMFQVIIYPPMESVFQREAGNLKEAEQGP